MGDIIYTVFTKPWPSMSLPALAGYVSALGFDGVELPVRPGFQVEPEHTERDLPRAADIFRAEGLRILSVAGPADERMIAVCEAAGVPLLRVMAAILPGEDYRAAEKRLRGEYDRLLPVLEQHGVCLGVQNHCDRFVPNALGLRALIGKYDPQHVAAVWDAAHEALVGMPPEFALDVIWPHLSMVNLKNGFWLPTSAPEGEHTTWQHYWTDGRHGLADWPRIVAELRRRAYQGVICLTAEYTDHDAVDRLIAQDLAFAKSLFDTTGTS